MSSERIAIVGCGAIGSTILAYLARGGRDVTGIDPWQERVYRVAAEGLALEGVDESFAVRPRVVFLDEVPRTEKFDVVILSVKGYDNRWAALYAGDILKPDGLLLSAQNGLHEIALPDVVGEDRVVGCVVAMGAEVLGPAAVKCSTGNERPHLFVGELSGTESARVTHLAELLEPAGPVAATTDIWAELWSKMTQNVMSNGLAGICGFTAGKLWTDPRCTDIVVALAHECALVARAQGSSIHPILGTISSQLLEAAERPGTPAWTEATELLCAEGRKRTGKRDNASSLLQDLWKGRRTEVDYFNGVLADLGARLGVPTPASTLITQTVHRLERQELETGPELLDEVHMLVLETTGTAQRSPRNRSANRSTIGASVNDRVFGSGDLRFELVDGWEHKPDGWHQFDVPAVCTDKEGNVYTFWRGDHRVVVYDRGGHCVDNWSEPPFDVRAHGMYMSPQEQLYLVDEGSHSVGRFTTSGKFLTQFGPSGAPSENGYDGENYRTVAFGSAPYRRPTGAAVAPSGEVYVSDGYGNARVHRFTADGTLIQSWGEPGRELEQFHVPHAVWVHTDGCVFVADRENERIQIFTLDGRLKSYWTDVQRPQGIFIDADEHVYIAEGSWPVGWESQRRGDITVPEPGRISIYDLQGEVLARWSNSDPAKPGYMLSPHGIWVDDEGSIFTCANVGTMGEHLGTGPAPALLKFARL